MQTEEVVKHYREGKTCREIAKLAGVCYQSIHTRLKRAGIQIRKRGPAVVGKGFKFRHWIADLKSRYGITEAQYNALLVKQGGKCAVCGRVPKHRLCVDHVHDSSKKVRGLLCKPCNNAVGLLKDSSDIALNLYDYLISNN